MAGRGGSGGGVGTGGSGGAIEVDASPPSPPSPPPTPEPEPPRPPAPDAAPEPTLPADASPGANPGGGPLGPMGVTVCVNADGPQGRDTYELLQSILGTNCIENPDGDHDPPVRHVREDVDAEVGPHFVFVSHRDVDSDLGRKGDKNRIEIKVHTGATDQQKGMLGETMTYTWRFKMNADMTLSNRFTHMFQMKSLEGNAGDPLITLTGARNGSGDRLQLRYYGDGSGGGTLADVSMAGLKNVWLEVQVRAEISQSGTFAFSVKKPDGTVVMDVNSEGLDLWRQGAYIRPKWGIYRGVDDELRAGEETVRFANFAVTAGPTPSTDCRGRRSRARPVFRPRAAGARRAAGGRAPPGCAGSSG